MFEIIVSSYAKNAYLQESLIFSRDTSSLDNPVKSLDSFFLIRFLIFGLTFALLMNCPWAERKVKMRTFSYLKVNYDIVRKGTYCSRTFQLTADQMIAMANNYRKKLALNEASGVYYMAPITGIIDATSILNRFGYIRETTRKVRD